MLYIPTNNPRTKDGGFGPWRCGVCKASNPAFVRMVIKNENLIICGSCLEEGIKIIHKTILEDAVHKGRLKGK
jgi:hypothetical protein